MWLSGSNFEVHSAGSDARTRAFVESPPLLPGEPVLRDFAVRLQKTEQDLGWISESASASANRMLDHAGAVINVPYTEQKSFAEEIVNRAGGLSSVLSPLGRPELLTPNDVILLSVRAWDEDGKSIEKLAAHARERGWRVVLFASRQGLPESFPLDDLVDNHARSGASEEAAINSLANVLNVWTWVCEYAAALTRRGRYPGVLLSILAPGSAEHNQPLQTRSGRSFLGATTVAYARGELGHIYHGRVERLLVELQQSATKSQVERAADIISAAIRGGGRVGVSTCNHLLLDELYHNRRTPMIPITAVRHSEAAFRELKRGDLLVWFGYVGVNTQYEDYLRAIREANLSLVTSYVTDANANNNAAEALVHIEQQWSVPDAEVPVAFPPGRLAPVSGLEQGLLYRLLEAAVEKNLAQ
jgi:hypothetical protein